MSELWYPRRMFASSAPFWFRVSWPTLTRPAQATSAPQAPRRAGPVFIHDAVTPYRGETLLSAMLRADIERHADEASSD